MTVNTNFSSNKVRANMKKYLISFHGDGRILFKIWITNLLLTICTLGIYYPWARANVKKYLYSSTYLGDYSFEFHGTGKQMFFGLLKFLAIFFVCSLCLEFIYDSFIVIDNSEIDTSEIATLEYLLKQNLLLLSYLLITLLLYAPISAMFIHGACRYRMSKTSYRNIRFGYRGSKKSFTLSLSKYTIFTLITVGFYYPWYVNNVRKYIYSNTRFGNIKLEFNGKGIGYAIELLKGCILCVLTLGIYYFWFKKRLFNFFYENMSFKVDNQLVKLKTKVTAGKIFKLIVINWLILLFTLGLGYPFAKVRSMQFIADNLELYGNIDLDKVIQTEENYANATGDAETAIDDSGDFFDMDIF